MAVPRLSQSAEAARMAAAQAEFNEKKWVWVPDDREGYLAGWVAREEEDIGEVVMAANGEVRAFTLLGLEGHAEVRFIDPTSAAVCSFEDEPSQVRQS